MGYLSMVGLYWLKEGSQSIGSSIKNDIIFPEGMPADLGTISLNRDDVTADIANKSKVKVNGKSYSGELEVIPDAVGDPSMFNWESSFWYVIKRGDQYGIRLKDTLSESRLTFQTMPQYPPQKEWIIEGTFQPVENQTVEITNKVGITYESELQGTVSFEMNGSEHELLATKSGDRLFIVFADATNGTDTYGGGRFLFVDRPAVGNKVTLDFNKVENPICALSDFATCPLPRPENYLDFAVNAGEKRVR